MKRICKDAFRLAGAVQETCSSELLGGPGADFLRGVAFWSNTLDRWTGKIAKRIGTRPSALHSTFHFLKEVSQNCFVFDVVNFENEEVSQNCFVFDVVKFKS